MYKITLTIGHNVGSYPMWSHETVCQAVRLYLDVNGFTALPCTGMWQGTTEASTRIEICETSPAKTQAILNNIPVLCSYLKQDVILCTCEDVKAGFVSSDTTTALSA